MKGRERGNYYFGFMMNSVSNQFFNFFVDILLRPLKTEIIATNEMKMDKEMTCREMNITRGIRNEK